MVNKRKKICISFSGQKLKLQSNWQGFYLQFFASAFGMSGMMQQCLRNWFFSAQSVSTYVISLNSKDKLCSYAELHVFTKHSLYNTNIHALLVFQVQSRVYWDLTPVVFHTFKFWGWRLLHPEKKRCMEYKLG